MTVKKTCGCQRLVWVPGWIDGAQRISRVVELFCMILLWWLQAIIHLSKHIECTTPSGNLNVK